MKYLFFLLVSSLIFAGEFEFKGNIGLNSQYYLNHPQDKHTSNITFHENFELKYTQDELSVYAKIYTQQDCYDTLASSKKNNRTFIRLDEAVVKYDFENDSIEAGKSIKFWGALEFENISDVFNSKDLREDAFKKEAKIGAYNITYSHYFDDGELNIILKLDETNQKMASYPYIYYIFPKILSYNDKLQTTHKDFKPSLFVSYSSSLDTTYAIDYAFIYERGYDSQRYFAPVVSNPLLYRQNSYIVNKFITYDTLVLGNTLVKLEAVYTNIEEKKTPISDYSHIAFGFEHTIQNIYKTHSLGLIGEYYNYTTYQNNKYNDLDLFETMQNDLFIGMRYALNDTEATSLIGGIVKDFQYNEEVYYLKYESRLLDALKLKLDYYYIEPSKNDKTVFSMLGRHQRISLDMSYYF